jgi:polar amino acid transport system substrate-binding protein
MVKLSFLGRVLLLIMVFSPVANADVLSDILERRNIRIGVAEFVPWTVKTQSGELIGFEIDVARKIASDMGVEPKIKLYEFEKLIPALQQGEIDIIAGGMAITPRRALQVNFTQTLANSGISIATNKDKTKNVSSLANLNDERFIISVVTDTLAHSVARMFFPEATIKVYKTSDQAQEEILENRAHAYVASEPEINFLALMNATKVDVPLSELIMASSEGLAVKKGEQELLNFLNSWVVARQTDKWLNTSHNYWFETIDWVSEISK